MGHRTALVIGAAAALVFVNCGDSTSELNGTVAEPGAWYSYRLDDLSSLPSTVPAGVGVGKIAN